MSFFKRIFGGGTKPPDSSSAFDKSMQHFLRGVQRLNAERIDEAMAAFDDAIELHPNNVSAWHWKGITLDVMDRPAEALTCFQQAIQIIPTDPCPYFDKGKAEVQLGLTADAMQSFQTFLKLADPAKHAQIIDEVRSRLSTVQMDRQDRTTPDNKQ